jgi:tetratricopeptide (TPR) repeat protein
VHNALAPALAVLLVVSVGCAADSGERREPPADADGPASTGATDPQPTLASDPAKTDPSEIDALRAAVEKNPGDAQARRRLAIALHDADLREEALEQFQKAAELSPGPRALLDLGLAYGSLSLLPEAEQAYRSLLEIQPEHPIALHNLGNLMVKRGELQPAIDLYRQALAADPGYVLAHYHLAEALKAAGRYEEAYRIYEKVVLDLEPRNAQDAATRNDALYGMASLDLQMGALERAGEMLAELVRIDPQHPKAHYAYGQVLLQLGRPEQAQREFEAHMRVIAELKPTGAVASGE